MKRVASVFNYVPGDDRTTAFPVARKEIFDMYEQASDCIWPHKDITLAQDKIDFATKLDEPRRRLTKWIHAFFASADGLVNVNLAERFSKEIAMKDAEYFYNLQQMMEDVHAHTYSKILDAIVPSEAERTRLINATRTIPSVAAMTEYIIECANSDAPLSERLFRMACVEGIFFTGCFCAIYWLTDNGLMPGLGHANELIDRDEWMHTQFSLYMTTLITPEHRLSREATYGVFKAAVDIATAFTNDAIPEPMAGMNAVLMRTYIESVADSLLACVGFAPLYGSKNPFDFVERRKMANRVDFFSRRVSDYSGAVHADTGYEIAESF